MDMDMGGHDIGSMSPPSTHMHGSGEGTAPMADEMMAHMTFYWGNEALVLFKGFPGTSGRLYIAALAFVFFLSFLVELLSHSQWIKSGSNNVGAGLVQTVLYGVRTGMNYMAMLAVMSFNVGIFLAAVVGHTLGFFFFGSRVFKDSPQNYKQIDKDKINDKYDVAL